MLIAIKGNDMSICQKIQDLEIDTQDIWNDDILNRKEVAEDFTRILADVEQPFVVSVDASYGMGKSFFLSRWREQLKKDGYQVAFFNAWNTDWEKDPMVPFIKTIIVSNAIVPIEGCCGENYTANKVRKFSCMSLKGKGAASGIRVIFVWEEEKQLISFIEIYYIR